MTFSDRLGAQVNGSSSELLPQDRPSDTREAAALERAGAAIDTDVADAFAELAAVGDKVEEGLGALADGLKALRDKLNSRVAQVRAAEADAKAKEEAAAKYVADLAAAQAAGETRPEGTPAEGTPEEEAAETPEEEAAEGDEPVEPPPDAEPVGAGTKSSKKS